MFIFTKRKEKKIKRKKLSDFREDYKDTSKDDLIDRLIIVKSDLENKSSVEFSATYILTIVVNLFAFGLGILNLIVGIVSPDEPKTSLGMLLGYPNMFLLFGILAMVLFILFGFLFNISSSNREILKIEELVLEERIKAIEVNLELNREKAEEKRLADKAKK